MAKQTVTILENGEEAQVNEYFIPTLLKHGLIYLCDDNDCGFYHVMDGHTLDEVLEQVEYEKF